MLVEREIRHDPLEPCILFLKLPNVPKLARFEVAELLLSDVERGLTDPDLPADVRDLGAVFDSPQGVRDLLFRELRALHGPTLLGLGGLQNLPRLLQF